MSEPSAWLEGHGGQSWRLGDKCSIGRAATNDIVIDDGKVSRGHALIHKQDAAEYWVVDLGSGNGTYINGRRVTLATRLNDGDVLTLGIVPLSFRQSTTVPTEPKQPVVEQQQTLLNVRNEKCWLLIADIKSSTSLAAQKPATEFAMLVGKWMARCRSIIETNGGAINKYLGDGFLAYWSANASKVEAIAKSLGEFRSFQKEDGAPPFRIVLHQGPIALGAGGAMNEDSLTGMDVILAFRMERLASGIGCDFLLSDATEPLLAPLLPLSEIGSFPVPGFAGAERKFFTVA